MTTTQFTNSPAPDSAVDAILLPVSSNGRPVGNWFDAVGKRLLEGTAGDRAAGGEIPTGMAVIELTRLELVSAVIRAAVKSDGKPVTEASLRKAFYYGLMVAEANQLTTVWLPLEDWLPDGMQKETALDALAESFRRFRAESGLLETVTISSSSLADRELATARFKSVLG